MIKFNKTPDTTYDQELAAKGKRRVMVGEPVEGGGMVYREKVVPIVSEALEPFFKMKKKGRARMNADNSVIADVEAAVGNMVRASKAAKADKAPRLGSKLAQAVEIVRALGKDDKEQCLAGIVTGLGVKRGNATIYYAKAKEILG